MSSEEEIKTSLKVSEIVEEIDAINSESDAINPKMENEVASVLGKVFTGFYLGIFGWLLIHTLLLFWDVLIPWNVPILDHFYFNLAFMIYIVLLMVTTLGIWKIWTDPFYSSVDGTRWWITLGNNSMPGVLLFSGMAGEPINKIGGGWFNDLRYPAFMIQPYFILLALLFINDMNVALKSNNDESGATHMFRPYRDRKFIKDFEEYEDNWRGILTCAYIYASYWFIFMVVSRSWIERVILYVLILITRNCFGLPSHFESFSRNYFLLFVPIYAAIRGYYSYDEYQAYESRASFIVKIVYCLSQIVIFAGWYSKSTSEIAKWTVPFMKKGTLSSEMKDPISSTKEE